VTAGRVLAGAGVLVALTSSAGLGAVPAGAAPSVDDTSVTVVATDMSPTTPAYSATPSRLTLTLAITNTTDETLYDVSVDVERDAPVTQQKLFERLMVDPAPSPDASVLSPLEPVALKTPLRPHETRRLPYSTTTSSANDTHGTGICLCFQRGGGVYPINFTVTATPDQGSGTTQVGFGQTYVPAFKDVPRPVQVSWVWPLIDRPHLLDGKTFLDDDLAASISPGGRLDRALTVVQKVASTVHLTLVIDPELLDELTTMSQPYAVEAGGKTVAGTGTSAAKAWLDRLRSIVMSVQVSLTPYADPDIDALTGAGLTWDDNFGPQQLTRAQGALGIPPMSDVAWPPGDAITSNALRRVLGHGSTSVVVVGDSTLPGGSQVTPRPDALATLPAHYGAPGALAAVTDHALQALSDRALAQGGSGLAALPELASDLAVRAAEQPDRPHYVVVTAPRYVDVDPNVAARVLHDTTRTAWSTSLRLNDAARTVTPVDHGQLVEPADEQQVPGSVLSVAQSATRFFGSFTSALSTDDANLLVGDVPAAIQRAESAAWRTDPTGGSMFARQLGAQMATWQRGVYIRRPSSGTYTLASTDSPLPITVVNTLPVDVKVRVRVATANGVAGFRTDDQRVQTIPRAASAKSPTLTTLKIQTHVQRAGTFQVNAVLLAPDGTRLGSTVPLSIHCTALGTVGVIITAVAGGVLVVAFAVRVTRRLRARGRRPAAEMARREPAGVKP
jgi:hypothetical protein